MSLNAWIMLIAAFVLGIVVGLVGSPWWERRIERRLQLRRLRQR